MSLYYYPNGEKSTVPIEALNQDNVYEYIAENGILAGPMLQAYINGMQAMGLLLTSIGCQESDAIQYREKIFELIDQKLQFCEYISENILMSTLPDAKAINSRLLSDYHP